VDLGNTYQTDTKCSEFTLLIAQHMKDNTLSELSKSDYFTILIDGATDTAVIENELIYILFFNREVFKVEFKYLCIRDVHNSTAQGLKDTLIKVFDEFGIDYKKKLIGFMADGASVNMGARGGLAGLLREDMSWLMAMHCLNHRLELAVKDALKGTFITAVTDMLTSIYYFYEKSPKHFVNYVNLLKS